jgi:hypothetical protein
VDGERRVFGEAARDVAAALRTHVRVPARAVWRAV